MNKKETKGKRAKTRPKSISYRLRCAKSANNGLSHFVMYEDVPKGKAIL